MITGLKLIGVESKTLFMQPTTASGGVQRRNPKIRIAPEAGDLAVYLSPEQQCVADSRSPMNSFEMSAAEETTTAATMTIASETVHLYSRPKKQRIQDDGFHTSAPEKTKTAAQMTDSMCFTYGPSDHSKTTIGTSGGGGVCSEDSLTKLDSTESCSTIRTTAVSIEQQMEDLHTTVSCPCGDSGDQLIKLPDDLIREVLSRLNDTAIVRLGSLNTTWRSELPRILYDEGHILSQHHSICQQDSGRSQDDLAARVQSSISWSVQYKQRASLFWRCPKDPRASRVGWHQLPNRCCL